ncbi:hypothetical protein FKP32DRAFT_1610274 [Trametes sanguinea]|nr:hypothetical protein FKP32DRAFT_1610274 [Trametes sanguinea]
MADARALLRAKRQEARIEHPLASYNAAGQLRCIACGIPIKQATAWEGHIGSKTHRTNAARLREERAREEQRLAEERERESLKRKAMDVDRAGDEEGEGEDEDGQGEAKRPRVESGHAGDDGEPRPASTAQARSALPADFFSDPSQAPPPAEEDENEGGEEEGGPAAAAAAPDVLDLEWQQFQATVVNAPDIRETYEHATIVAEPVLAPEEGEEEVLDEEALRRKKETEERELIMDRLLEEEQAQEEADARVAQLKSKLEALKKKREAARAAKKGAKAS